MSLSRFERYQRDGGSADFGSYLVSLGESLIDAMPDQDFERLRLRRMSGPQRAAAAKREQEKIFDQMVQGHKMTSFSVGPIDEAEKWANFDPNSKVLPAHTVRIL